MLVSLIFFNVVHLIFGDDSQIHQVPILGNVRLDQLSRVRSVADERKAWAGLSDPYIAPVIQRV